MVRMMLFCERRLPSLPLRSSRVSAPSLIAAHFVHDRFCYVHADCAFIVLPGLELAAAR
jgi:hypothetical protein